MIQTTIPTKHGSINLPAFFPDATKAVVKSLDSIDLINAGVEGLVVNIFHMLNHGAINITRQMGGIHRFMNWKNPIITDSGGFQVMSLIRQNPKMGTIRENKVVFYPQGSKDQKIILTPEKVVQTQLRLGSDIVMCLDDCTKPEEPEQEQLESIERTANWAARCKKEFVKLTKNWESKPLLLAIVQGGQSKRLRQKCARDLLNIGFDGYGFGGWPILPNGKLDNEIIKFTSELLPEDKIKYAMGVGKPENIRDCVNAGWQLFDCVIPTRDARHKRLYVFDDIPTKELLKNRIFTITYTFKILSANTAKNRSIQTVVATPARITRELILIIFLK